MSTREGPQQLTGRFVVLRHDTPPGHARGLHWDFMLECEGALRTWALAEEPRDACQIAAESLPDHRLAYLDLEGPISGGRGAVVRLDRGTYQGRRTVDGGWSIHLAGDRLRGAVTLAPCPTESLAAAAQRFVFSFSAERLAIDG